MNRLLLHIYLQTHTLSCTQGAQPFGHRSEDCECVPLACLLFLFLNLRSSSLSSLCLRQSPPFILTFTRERKEDHYDFSFSRPFFHLDPRSHSLVTRFPGLRFELSSLLPPSFCQTYPPLILILILSMSGHFSFINRKRIAPDRTISAHSLRWRRTISHSLSLSLYPSLLKGCLSCRAVT